MSEATTLHSIFQKALTDVATMADASGLMGSVSAHSGKNFTEMFSESGRLPIMPDAHITKALLLYVASFMREELLAGERVIAYVGLTAIDVMNSQDRGASDQIPNLVPDETPMRFREVRDGSPDLLRVGTKEWASAPYEIAHLTDGQKSVFVAFKRVLLFTSP